MKNKLILLGAVLFGILAGILHYGYLKSRDREVAAEIARLRERAEPIPVIAAAADLPRGSVLRPRDLGVLEVPASSVRGHHIGIEDRMRIFGRKLLHPVSRLSPVLWSDLEGGRPGDAGLARDIKPRMRAISINVSGAAAVSGMVRPADRVDVLGTFTFPSPTRPDEMELITMTVLQDVLVLACGQETAKTPGGDRRPGGGYSLVTLEVTPREAEVLVFAEQVKGRLALSLRNPTDVYFERQLPRVNVERIEAELQRLNEFRQTRLLEKRIEEE